MDYTAVGQTTHLAARMEQMAPPGTILLAPETLALAEGFVQVAARGPVPVKGLAEPVEVYELAGASAVRSRFQAAAARGFSRFVGRDTEMEQLHRALEHAGGPRPSRRRGGGARGWQVPPGPRIHLLAPHAELAHRGGQLGLLR